ncbi:hypothetical protein DPMN_121223 [Dreissena polymorpha]|uniref:Uncharacterized protein n=1 Tax=Dreissena polymorpha TaxID=45954 RepID=A0A9D4JPB2_DREPO|nr:hypothetical protein DPMN_121223 [Dreissena polymorpha]
MQSLESAIRGLLRTSDVRESFRQSIHEMLTASNRPPTSSIEDSLRKELQKHVRISSKTEGVELIKPRTIESFVNDRSFSE